MYDYTISRITNVALFVYCIVSSPIVILLSREELDALWSITAKVASTQARYTFCIRNNLRTVIRRAFSFAFLTLRVELVYVTYRS